MNYKMLVEEYISLVVLYNDSNIKSHIKAYYRSLPTVFNLSESDYTEFRNVIKRNKESLYNTMKDITNVELKRKLNGWKWVDNSCWLDTLFVNLIGMKDSPFIDIVKKYGDSDKIHKSILNWITLLESNTAIPYGGICISSTIREQIKKKCEKLTLPALPDCNSFIGSKMGITNQTIRILFSMYNIKYDYTYIGYNPHNIDAIFKNINYDSIHDIFYTEYRKNRIVFNIEDTLENKRSDVIELTKYSNTGDLVNHIKKETVDKLRYDSTNNNFYLVNDPTVSFNLEKPPTLGERAIPRFNEAVNKLKNGASLEQWDYSALYFSMIYEPQTKVIDETRISSRYNNSKINAIKKMITAIIDFFPQYQYDFKMDDVNKLSVSSTSVNILTDIREETHPSIGYNDKTIPLDYFLNAINIKNIDELTILVVNMENNNSDHLIPLDVTIGKYKFRLRGASLGTSIHYTSIISDKYYNYFFIDVAVGGANKISPFSARTVDIINNEQHSGVSLKNNVTMLYYYKL